MLTWERDLIQIRTLEWRPVTPGNPVGATLDGIVQTVFLSGGCYWALTMSGLFMAGREALLAGNRLKAALIGGRPILIRPCDCRQAPLTNGENLANDANPVTATISAAALRATTATLTRVSGGRNFRVGDQFSPSHSTWGLRMYRIEKITGGTAMAPVVEFSPPLRQATTAGQSVDFNRPGVWMRLAGGFNIDQTIRGRVNTGEVSFVELERPPTAAEAAA